MFARKIRFVFDAPRSSARSLPCPYTAGYPRVHCVFPISRVHRPATVDKEALPRLKTFRHWSQHPSGTRDDGTSRLPLQTTRQESQALLKNENRNQVINPSYGVHQTAKHARVIVLPDAGMCGQGLNIAPRRAEVRCQVLRPSRVCQGEL